MGRNSTAMGLLRFAVSSNGSAQPDVAGHGKGRARKGDDSPSRARELLSSDALRNRLEMLRYGLEMQRH